jgi:hypothetical protein
MMSVLWYELMQSVPQHGDAAVNGEQEAGNRLMKDSPHGGLYAEQTGKFSNLPILATCETFDNRNRRAVR